MTQIGFKNRILVLFASITTTLSTVVAHSGEEEARTTGMMMSNDGWMHNAGHMAGYNMWGMGSWGLVPGVLIWVLIILGIIYLYQNIIEDKEE